MSQIQLRVSILLMCFWLDQIIHVIHLLREFIDSPFSWIASTSWSSVLAKYSLACANEFSACFTTFFAASICWTLDRFFFVNSFRIFCIWCSGFKCAVTSKYYDRENKCFDMAGMLKDLEEADNHSIFIFHSCAHIHL